MSLPTKNRDIMLNSSADRKQRSQNKKVKNIFFTAKKDLTIDTNKNLPPKINTFNSSQKLKQKYQTSSSNPNNFDKFKINLPVILNNVANYNVRIGDNKNKLYDNYLKEKKQNFHIEPDPIIRENLLNEIIVNESNIQSKNIEISNLQMLCDNLEKQNITSRYFINRFLEKENNDNLQFEVSQQMQGQKQRPIDNENDYNIINNNISNDNINSISNDNINSISNDNIINSNNINVDNIDVNIINGNNSDDINNENEIINKEQSSFEQDNQSFYDTEYDKKIESYKRMNKSNEFYTNKNKDSKQNLISLSKKDSLDIEIIKKQMFLYEQELGKKMQKLEKIKEHEISNKYMKLKPKLDKKTKELNEIFAKCENLKNLINEKETTLNFYILKSEKLTSLNRNLNKKSSNNLKIIYESCVKRKKDLEMRKEKLIKKIKSHYKELEEISKKNKDLEKKNQELENELSEYQYLLNEKIKNTNAIDITYSKEERLKKHITLNKKKIKELEIANDEINKLIDDYEKNQRNILIEKSNIPRQNKEKIKQLEIKIQKIKNEISQIQNQKKDNGTKMQEEIDKKMEIFDDKNKEVKNYLEQKENLKHELEGLNDDFQRQKRNFDAKEVQLQKLNKQLFVLQNENDLDESNEENIQKSKNMNMKDDDGCNEIIQEKIKVLADVREINNQNKMISEEISKNKKLLIEKRDELKTYKEKK